jgi:asparagine synthase (glutamine-hydrolysing)
VKAVCGVYDRLMPDEERRYSTAAARGLGIPITHRPADDYGLFQEWDAPLLRRPEPGKDPFAAMEVALLQDAAGHSRVVLTGMGGDPPFRDSPLFLRPLGSADFARRALGSAVYALTRFALPPLGVRTRLRQAVRRGPAATPPLPEWISGDLADAFRLRERWEAALRPLPVDPSRPRGIATYTSKFWPEMFQYWDAASSSMRLEQRHPLYDTRLIAFLLALPYLPWAVDKHLVRRAMTGILPSAVVRRPKTPLADNPWRVRSAQFEAIMETFEPTQTLGRYVETGGIVRRSPPGDDGNEMWVASRIVGLDHWLRQEGHR